MVFHSYENIFNRLTGFCNSETIFETITNNDIDSIEKFVREELSLMWHEKKIELPHGSESKDAFGLYQSNPNRFKFLPGDRKLINIIVNNVRSCKSNEDLKIVIPNDSVENSNLSEPLASNISAQRTTKIARLQCI